MRFRKGKPAPELEGRNAKASRGGKPALFYFYSDGCGACRPMTPIIEELAKMRKDVFKVDISKDMATAPRAGNTSAGCCLNSSDSATLAA